jgi:hypothetical protein
VSGCGTLTFRLGRKSPQLAVRETTASSNANRQDDTLCEERDLDINGKGGRARPTNGTESFDKSIKGS